MTLLNRWVIVGASLVLAGCAQQGAVKEAQAHALAVAPSTSAPMTPPAVVAAASGAADALLQKCQLASQQRKRRSYPHHDLDAILYQQTAPEYQANTRTVYRAAATQLPLLLDAHQRSGVLAPPVVVFDLDETVLDNSRYQGRLIDEGRSYDSDLWDCWVGQQQALLVPGADALFTQMAGANIRARFITNRKCVARPGDNDLCPQERETLDNLNTLITGTGYVATAEELMLRNEPDPANPSGPRRWSDEEKKFRRNDVAAKATIIMMVGDDLGDFLDDVRKTKIAYRRGRFDAVGVADHWGTSWFMLPNAMYGSWQDAVDLETITVGTEEVPKPRQDVVEAFAYPK